MFECEYPLIPELALGLSKIVLGCNRLRETLLSLYEFKKYCDFSLRLCESEKSLSEIVQVCVMFGKDCASLHSAQYFECQV